MGCNCGGRSSGVRSGGSVGNSFRITHTNGAVSHFPSEREAEKNYKAYRASSDPRERGVELHRMKRVSGELVVDDLYVPPAT